MKIKLKDLLIQDARNDIKQYAQKLKFNITDQFIDTLQQRVGKKNLKTVGKWYLQIVQKYKSEGQNAIHGNFEHLMDVFTEFEKQINTREGKSKFENLGKVIKDKQLLKSIKKQYKIPPNISGYKDVWQFLQLVEQLLMIFYHYDNNNIYYGKGKQGPAIQLDIDTQQGDTKSSYKKQYIDRLKHYMGEYYLGKYKQYSIFAVPSHNGGIQGMWTNSWCTARGTVSFYDSYSAKGNLIAFLDVDKISDAYEKYKTAVDDGDYKQAEKWFTKKTAGDSSGLGSQVKADWGYQITAVIQPGFFRLITDSSSSYQSNNFRGVSINNQMSMQLLKAIKVLYDKNPSLYNITDSCKRYNEKKITKESIAPWQLLISSNIEEDDKAISFDAQKGTNGKIAGVMFKSGWYDLTQLNEDNIFFTQTECLTNKKANGKVQLRNLKTKKIQIRAQNGDFELKDSQIDQLTIVLDNKKDNCIINNCKIGKIYIDDMVVDDNMSLKDRGKIIISGNVGSIEGVNMYDYLGFPVLNVIDKTNCKDLKDVVTNVTDQNFIKYQEMFDNQEQFSLNQSVNYNTIINGFRFIL